MVTLVITNFNSLAIQLGVPGILATQSFAAGIAESGFFIPPFAPVRRLCGGKGGEGGFGCGDGVVPRWPRHGLFYRTDGGGNGNLSLLGTEEQFDAFLNKLCQVTADERSEAMALFLKKVDEELSAIVNNLHHVGLSKKSVMLAKMGISMLQQRADKICLIARNEECLAFGWIRSSITQPSVAIAGWLSVILEEGEKEGFDNEDVLRMFNQYIHNTPCERMLAGIVYEVSWASEEFMRQIKNFLGLKKGDAHVVRDDRTIIFTPQPNPQQIESLDSSEVFYLKICLKILGWELRREPDQDGLPHYRLYL